MPGQAANTEAVTPVQYLNSHPAADLSASPSVEVRIDKVVLDACPGVKSAELILALQTELSRLLAEQGIPCGRRAEYAHISLDCGAFHFRPGAGTRIIAAELARAIHSGLNLSLEA